MHRLRRDVPSNPPMPWACAFALLCASLSFAIGTSRVDIERIESPTWRAEGVSFEVNWTAHPLTAEARIARVVMLDQAAGSATSAAHELRDLRIRCARLDLADSDIACRDATLWGKMAALGEQRLAGSLRFDRASRALAIDLRGLRIGAGNVRVIANWPGDSRRPWSLRAQLANVNLAALARAFKAIVPQSPAVYLEGVLDGDVNLSGIAASFRAVEWNVRAQNVTAANAEGTLASEGLQFSARGSLKKSATNEPWIYNIALTSAAGQVYAEPIFIDLTRHPLTLNTAGRFAKKTLDIQEFAIEQQAALHATGSARVQLAEAIRIQTLQLNVRRAELPGAYALYAQPLLIDTALGALTTSGVLRGRIALIDNSPAELAMELRDVQANDQQRHISIANANGELHWHADNAPTRIAEKASQVGWSAAKLLGLEFGAAELRFATHDRNFELQHAVRIPLFDGGVRIAALRIAHAARPDMTLQLDAEVEPISVQKLCAAFGWPQFGGRVAGKLSDLTLHQGVVTLGATLHADVFNGRVSFANLRLEQVFSKWPRFSADIAIDNVDLEQVTSAFSFGLITGRLSGTIDELRLFNWSPASFEARLYTPKDDRSRHRISQRAVKNIGNLGGSGSGVAAALSSGFLRFFEEFNYERLGISCILKNDVCLMSGIEPAPNGYYLVKGRGIPRIDVIGNANRVDWPRLVRQLKAATEAQGVEVEK